MLSIVARPAGIRMCKVAMTACLSASGQRQATGGWQGQTDCGNG